MLTRKGPETTRLTLPFCVLQGKNNWDRQSALEAGVSDWFKLDQEHLYKGVRLKISISEEGFKKKSWLSCLPALTNHRRSWLAHYGGQRKRNVHQPFPVAARFPPEVRDPFPWVLCKLGKSCQYQRSISFSLLSHQCFSSLLSSPYGDFPRF